MKRFCSLLSTVLLAASVTTAFAGGGRGGGGPGGAPGGNNTLGMNTNFYTNEFQLLSDKVTLSDEQKPKVKARVDAMNAELQSILQAAQNVPAARGAAPAPGGGGRGGFGGGGGGFGAPAVATPLTPEQIKIRDDFQLLANQHQVKINSELTQPQKLQWETYKLSTFLDPKLATLNLTEDQKTKVNALVADCAKSLAAMTDARDIDTYEGKLIRKIVADILTEQQSARLFELPMGTTANGRGGVAAAPAGGRGAPGGAPGGQGGRGGRGEQGDR